MRKYLNPTKRIAVLISGLALICSGCTIGRHRLEPKMGRYDVETHYRSEAFQNIHVAEAPRPVTIDVECRFFGRNWPTIVRRIRPDIVSGLTANGVFVETDEANSASAGRLLVVVNRTTSAKEFAEALSGVVTTAFTLGLVSNDHDLFYNMDVTYTPPGGQPIAWKCSHPVHATIGAKSMLRYESTLPPKDVLPELTEGMAAKFAMDFAMSNPSAQSGITRASESAASPAATTVRNLPAPATPGTTETQPYTIQPAIASESTSTILR